MVSILGPARGEVRPFVIQITVAVAFALQLFLLAGVLPSPVLAATNLVTNGSFEASSGTNNPTGWTKGRWGTNTAIFTHPVPGVSGNGAKIALTSRSTGDAKWAFNRVTVEEGATYRYRNSYKATVPTYITVEFQKADGTLTYLDIAQPAAASAFTQSDETFTVPDDVVRLTVFHLINQVGELTIDEVSLEQISGAPPPPPPPSSSNLIENPSVEEPDQNGTNPRGWGRGRWGTNTATFSYPSAGIHGSDAAKVTLSNYSTGDAKWYFNRINAKEHASYRFSNQYRSSVPSYVTVEFTFQNGTRSYLDLGLIAPSGGSWESFEAEFVAPQGVVALTIFHLIKSNGSLEIDNYVLRQVSSGATGFDQAYFSLTFDDGRRSTYDVGLPIVEAAGFQSTHFIISGRMSASFPGYIKPAEVRDIHNRGHEIGAHTRTHADLRTLSDSQLQSEVAGSKSDLEALGIGPVVSFAYPFGSYDSRVIEAVDNAGFRAARTTQSGQNVIHESPLVLKRIPGDGTPLSVLKAQVDDAIENKTWLIFAFHDITTTPGTYNTSPDTLRGLVSYLQEKSATVITVEEGVQLLEQTP